MGFETDRHALPKETHVFQFRSFNIPAPVFFAKGLSPTEKNLITLIDILDHATDHCWATDQYLADSLGCAVNSVTNAISKLKSKGWVKSISYDGKIRRLTTKLSEGWAAMTPGSTDLPGQVIEAHRPTQIGSTDLPKQVDRPTQIGNGYYNSENELEKREEEASLQIFQEHFPEFTPSPFQQDQMRSSITDLHLWRESVEYWAGNGHQPRSIGKLLDMHTRKENEKSKPPPLSATPVVTQDPCPYCTGTLGPNLCPLVKRSSTGECTWGGR